MTSFAFKTQQQTGDVGQRVAIAFYKSDPNVICIEDMSLDKDYQQAGVDMLVKYAGGRNVLVEVKTDTHDEINFFFETKSGDKAGCFLKTTANDMLYVFQKTGRMYLLPVEETRRWVLENSKRWTLKEVNSHSTRGQWKGVGYLVPVREVVRSVPFVRIYRVRYSFEQVA